jgi:hypothetical protein
MAEGALIGALRFILGADTAQLDTSLKRASGSMRGAAQAGEAMGRAIGAQFGRLAAMGAGFLSLSRAVAAFNSTIEDVKALDRLATATGTSIAALSSLRAVVESTGGDFQKLSGVLEQHGQRMREALRDPMSEGALALGLLGVSARDAQGNLLTLDQMLPQLADAFGRYADGANKSAIMSRLFGETGGPEMARLLALGGAELERRRAQHEALNRAADPEKIREFIRAQAELRGLARTFNDELTTFLIPGLRRYLQGFNDTITALNYWRRGVDYSRMSIQDLTVMIAVAEERAREFRRLIETRPHERGLIETWRQGLSRAKEDADIFRRMIEELRWAGTVTPVEDQAPDPDAARRRIEALRFELDQFLQSVTGEQTILETINNAWLRHADVVVEAQARIREAYGDTLDGRRMMANVTRQLELQEQRAILDTASLAAKTITDLFPKQKGAAIAAAVINTAVAVTKALTSGIPPWNFAQAALVAAQGLAQINSIRSTNLSGGGSVPAVGGGSMAAEPAAAAGGQQPQTALTINLPGGQYFSTDQVRALIQGFNEYTLNGGTLFATAVR